MWSKEFLAVINGMSATALSIFAQHMTLEDAKEMEEKLALGACCTTREYDDGVVVMIDYTQKGYATMEDVFAEFFGKPKGP